MFGLQSLWSAAHYRRNIAVIVCNNRSYRILKINIRKYWEDLHIAPTAFPHMDLNDPDIAFSDLGRGFGIPSQSVSDTAGLVDAFRAAIETTGPFLIEVLITRSLS